MRKLRAIRPFGDRVARQYTNLLSPHVPVMYRMAYRWTQHRQESEDLVQEVLLSLVGKLEEIKNVDLLRPWLIKILYRKFVDGYRRRMTSPVQADSTWHGDHDFIEELSSSQPEMSDRLAWQDALLKGLETLDDDQRDAILLHDVEGYTAQEIANITDVSPGTVKSRIHRGRNKLKKFLRAGTISGPHSC